MLGQKFDLMSLLFGYTGGPRYMRSFYLQIRVYAMGKSRLKFILCDNLLYLLGVNAIFH